MFMLTCVVCWLRQCHRESLVRLGDPGESHPNGDRLRPGAAVVHVAGQWFTSQVSGYKDDLLAFCAVCVDSFNIALVDPKCFRK